MILLDTHSLIWTMLNQGKLSSPALAAIVEANRAREPIAISIFSVWELAHLVTRKRLSIHLPLDTFLHEIEQRFSTLPLSRQIALEAARFPAPFPKDPMDRLIASTALCGGHTLITADRAILAARVCKTLW